MFPAWLNRCAWRRLPARQASWCSFCKKRFNHNCPWCQTASGVTIQYKITRFLNTKLTSAYPLVSNLGDDVGRRGKKNVAEGIAEHVFPYPLVPFENVPSEDAPLELIIQYVNRRFPQLSKPRGPGFSNQAARWLVYLHSITDRVDLWNPEFHELAHHHDVWT